MAQRFLLLVMAAGHVPSLAAGFVYRTWAMRRRSTPAAVLVAAGLVGVATTGSAWAQQPGEMPPSGSPPVVRYVEIKSTAQSDVLAVEPETYLYYIQTKPSSGQFGRWIRYDEKTVLEDFRRLWATNFLDDLVIDVKDAPYPNGVIGKHIVFDLEERQRVKVVDYVGSKRVEQSKIEDTLREKNLVLRLDSFLDAGVLSRVRAVVRELYAEKGYVYAAVTHEIRPVAGGPKLVHVSFHIDEGPKVTIRDIEFIGNEAVTDFSLTRRMKENKEQGFFSFIRGGGTYKEARFEEDAQQIVELYRDRGYIAARVGTPELKVLEDSPDASTRWIQLRIPVTEGQRYRVGDLKFEGQDVVKEEALRRLFKIDPGEWYSEKQFRKGLTKAQEIFGSGGYMEFTGYPDLRPRPVGGTAIVDVTMRLQTGKQYFVNRLTFLGNTTTRDNVVRREMRLYEAGVFNTEALKHSVKRLNQLGYFKALEGDAIKVEKTPGANDKVDVTLALEEQNRNQVMFGAGLSQYEGVFGNLSYTTANFLGRGETATISAQIGARASSYQLAFTEPYVFDRPLTAGFDLFSRKIDYLAADGNVGYSEVRAGTDVTLGWSVASFARLFGTYGYEVIDTAIRDDLLDTGDAGNPGDPVFNPFLDEGRHIESRVTPSLVYNTVDNPIMPRSGIRLTGTVQVAGGLLGGTMDYVRPDVELVMYRPVGPRMAIGVRGQTGWVRPFGSTEELPYYRRFFLGGETEIRGYDIRTVGPMDAKLRAVGGDKFVLFNAEYYIDIMGPVRAVLFHDAGQAFLETEPINLRLLRTSSGAELRVFIPMLNVPFRLIYAWNVYRDSFQPARTFKFAVGTTF